MSRAGDVVSQGAPQLRQRRCRPRPWTVQPRLPVGHDRHRFAVLSGGVRVAGGHDDYARRQCRTARSEPLRAGLLRASGHRHRRHGGRRQLGRPHRADRAALHVRRHVHRGSSDRGNRLQHGHTRGRSPRARLRHGCHDRRPVCGCRARVSGTTASVDLCRLRRRLGHPLADRAGGRRCRHRSVELALGVPRRGRTRADRHGDGRSGHAQPVRPGPIRGRGRGGRRHRGAVVVRSDAVGHSGCAVRARSRPALLGSDGRRCARRSGGGRGDRGSAIPGAARHTHGPTGCPP